MGSASSLLPLVLVLVGCGDPVRSSAVDALGGEAPGVRQGPLHRPGQPCLLCHDGSVGSPEEFSVAGTVFLAPSGAEPVNGANVRLVDSGGATFDATTNAAGNFYVPASQWAPHYPLATSVHSPGGPTVVMRSLVHRDGSCAGCHFDPAGPASAGHIYVQLDDGSAPP